MVKTNPREKVKIIEKDILKHRMYHELFFETVPPVLRMDDRISMRFGLESRLPFLDHRLAEFCFSLPNRIKIHDGLAKQIMRTAMDGILNDKVRLRKEKVGFNAPMNDWMKKELREELKEFLNQDLRIYDYMKKDVLMGFWKEHQEGKDNHMMLFWNVIQLELWLDYTDKWQKIIEMRSKNKKKEAGEK